MLLTSCATTPEYEYYRGDGRRFEGAKRIAIGTTIRSEGAKQYQNEGLSADIRRAAATIPGVTIVEHFRDADLAIIVTVSDRSCLDHCRPRRTRWFWRAELYEPTRADEYATLEGGQVLRSRRLLARQVSKAIDLLIHSKFEETARKTRNY